MLNVESKNLGMLSTTLRLGSVLRVGSTFGRWQMADGKDAVCICVWVLV